MKLQIVQRKIIQESPAFDAWCKDVVHPDPRCMVILDLEGVNFVLEVTLEDFSIQDNFFYGGHALAAQSGYSVRKQAVVEIFVGHYIPPPGNMGEVVGLDLFFDAQLKQNGRGSQFAHETSCRTIDGAMCPHHLIDVATESVVIDRALPVRIMSEISLLRRVFCFSSSTRHLELNQVRSGRHG